MEVILCKEVLTAYNAEIQYSRQGHSKVPWREAEVKKSVKSEKVVKK